MAITSTSSRGETILCFLRRPAAADADTRLSLCRGVFDILIQKDGVSRCVGSYDNKGSFGELALMYNTPRAATIRAAQEGALWALVRSLPALDTLFTQGHISQYFSITLSQLSSWHSG